MKDLTTKRTIQTEDESIIRFATVDRLPGELKEKVEISISTTVESFHDSIRNEVSSPFINTHNMTDSVLISNKQNCKSYYNSSTIRLLSINFGIDLSRAIFYMKTNNSPLVTYYKGYYYMVMPIEYNMYTVQNMIEMGVI